jgi:transcriptional regulator with XRE-family HTH domain
MPKTVNYAQWSLEPYCIGMKLRALRTQKRLTLSRLAGETGLSTALLSKLETDRMIPTLSTLATISRVYGVGLGHFFTEPERHTLSITRNALLERGGRGAEPVKSIPLNSVVGSPCLLAQMIEVPAGGTAQVLESGDGETCGMVYVIEGRLELDAGGLHEILETGDCVFVQGLMPLAWGASGKNRCRVLAVRPAKTPR